VSSEVSDQRSGGAVPTTYIALVDVYGQIVGTDAGSKLNVIVDTSTYSPDGTYYPPILGGTTQFTSENGVFVVKGVEFTANPGKNYSLSFTTDGIDTDLPQNEAYLKALSSEGKSEVSFDMKIALRECIEGEAFTESGLCDRCEPEEEYSLQLLSEPGGCKPCPKRKAYCLGGADIGPKPNYWRESNLTDTFIECLNQRACLGYVEPSKNPLGQCEKGF